MRALRRRRGPLARPERRGAAPKRYAPRIFHRPERWDAITKPPPDAARDGLVRAARRRVPIKVYRGRNKLECVSFSTKSLFIYAPGRDNNGRARPTAGRRCGAAAAADGLDTSPRRRSLRAALINWEPLRLHAYYERCVATATTPHRRRTRRGLPTRRHCVAIERRVSEHKHAHTYTRETFTRPGPTRRERAEPSRELPCRSCYVFSFLGQSCLETSRHNDGRRAVRISLRQWAGAAARGPLYAYEGTGPRVIIHVIYDTRNAFFAIKTHFIPLGVGSLRNSITSTTIHNDVLINALTRRADVAGPVRPTGGCRRRVAGCPNSAVCIIAAAVHVSRLLCGPARTHDNHIRGVDTRRTRCRERR
ncbi:hypothetical protein EVAR_50002_1 [Eumeta japonica]|uniref:Uncharacterized protein n=1 Tax=Eumeta variegata TaxID=151549 RepID=A0A4C1XSK1_EUMVA|nr:hypothetical protein EVAR_50002_1 [Eumeta japonica]